MEGIYIYKRGRGPYPYVYPLIVLSICFALCVKTRREVIKKWKKNNAEWAPFYCHANISTCSCCVVSSHSPHHFPLLISPSSLLLRGTISFFFMSVDHHCVYIYIFNELILSVCAILLIFFFW